MTFADEKSKCTVDGDGAGWRTKPLASSLSMMRFVPAPGTFQVTFIGLLVPVVELCETVVLKLLAQLASNTMLPLGMVHNELKFPVVID